MTPTAVLNTHLWLVATVCAVVLVGLLTYRVTHILVSMLVDAMIQTKEADAARLSSLRRFAQLGLVGHAVQFVALVAMAGVRVLMACIRAGFFLLYALLPLMVLSCALAVLAQNWSRSIAVLTDVFNSGGLASTLRTVLLAPLTVLDYVGTYGLPIWNLAVFIFFQTPLQVLFWLLRGTGAYHLVAALLEVGRAAPALAYGIRDFAAANAGGACPSEHCALSATNGATTTCLQMGLSVVAEACLAPGRRDMDFVPAFAHLQRSAAHLLLGLGASCEALGVVLNVTFFPLTDPTAWAAVGSGLNAALSAGVGAPTTAVQRCGLAGGILRRPAMCMPDFGPAWDHGVRAALGVGDALTHWFDAAYLLLFDAETIERACVQNSSYVALWEDRAARALFGANTTLLVRLTQGQFALTDGLSVVYVREDPLVKTYAPQAWPFAVDARVGIARAWLPTGVQAADGGVGLFGCTCVDGGAAAGVQIRCAAVARSGLAYVLPVDFSLAAEAQLLTCDRTRLQVQSVRWPQQRPSVVALGGSLPPPCTDAATCTAADVAVWLVPVCGAQDGRKALACQSEQRFTRGICFPYCLALRLQHEGFNRPLTMRGAAEWTDGVIMAQRDCTGATAQMMPSLSTPQPQQGIRTVCTVGGDVTGAALPQQEILVAQQQQTTCAFATTCTTAVADKGTLAAYAPNSSLPALAETASEGVRLIQDGQPLVIGGGVFMRQFTPIDSRLPVGQVAPSYFDFPSLVGDDYNDYTVEVGSPDGVPAAASPVTPSARPAYVLPGAAAIDPPPENILQPSIPFNPGTLTPDGALWWASNPSYETWYAFAEYCASRGHVHETQIMLLSSYAPLRFQRARYKDACYTRAADGRRVCAADTFSAALLSQAFTLPTLTSAQVTQTTRLYDLCASGQAFDLYAEAVEWFDAANVVVAVRRGTFADLGALLLGQPPGGRTVYYFVSATDVSQAREGEPWPTTAFGAALSLLAATSSSAENSTNAAVVTEALLFATCPALRALPNLGAVVGHSVAGALRIGQMACGLLTNPFATIELLDAVGAGTCPDNALRHSVLANCGTALYTLEPAFAEAYAASANAWGVVAWLVAVILPPGLAPTADALGRPTTAAMLSAFLNGAAVTGEATKIVGLFNVPQALEAFDLDAQSLLEGGLSRRLLGSRLSMLAHGGKSILGDMSSVATTGLKGFMRLGSIMLTVVQGSVFAGADLGALLATQSPPGNLAGTVVGAPSIAWAQLTYGVLSHGFVTILADLRAGHPSVAPLFMLVHDALDQFDSDVDTHHRQACAGVRLMLGYDSQLAKGLALNCLAAADLMRGTLLTASTLLVDVALFRCLCVRPGGQDYLGYVQAQCTDYIPGSRKAYWQGTLSAAVAKSGSSGGGGVPAMCRAYLDGIQTQVYGAFDPWVTNAIASVTALGSFLDEVLVPGAHPGGCSVVTTNPGAIVLTPLPITHFQVCGQTTACQALCADSIGLFQFELDRVRAGGADPNAPAATYDLSVESPFFNPYTSSAASGVTDADTLLALATLPAVNASANCRLQCGGGGQQQQCLALLTGHGLAALQVRFFCLPDPSNLLSTLFPLGLDGFTLSETDFMRAAEGYAFVHADLVWQPGGAPPYAVVYTARSVSSVALDGSVVMATAHEAFVWLPDGAGDARRVRIVGSDDLAAGMLTPQVQAGLFADQGGVLLKPQVGTVAITNLLPVDSGVPGQLVFFLAFTAQLQGLPSSSSTTTQQSSSVIGGYTLEAIVTWCDPSAAMAAGCRARTDFFVPCPLACNTGLDRTCGGRCNGGLDAALSLGQQGTLLQVPAERGGGYLFLPSMQLNALASSGGSSSAMRLLALRVPQLDPYRGVTALPLSLRDAGLPISADATTLAMLGSWTRAHVFSPLLNAVQKPIRDLRTHTTTAADGGGGGLEPFFQAPDGAQGPSLIGNGLSGGLAGQWLAETRPVRGPYGWQLRAFQSQTTRASANLQLNCTYLSCAGCSTARLRLLCHQAQDCALQNCVGTVVQTRSVLCGIGGVIEKTSRHAIVTWRAIHLTFGELGLLVMQGLSGDTLVHRITLRFPTDQFYTLLCEFKNTLAAVVALGVSVGNVFAAGLSAGSGAKFDLTGKQDVGALAGEGILKSTSLANLIYNVLSTGTLLPTLALHRWFLCIANASALDQTFNQGGLTIQFGDVGMDASWMACAKLEGLGTILASADAATSTSDAVTEFVQFTTTLLSGLGDTVLYGMQLSFTSTIDYMKGLVYCVQDVLYTFNLRQCKVPDYALRYVLRCACNDAPYRIPAPQRGAGWQDGALWCVGTLSMLLSDGSIGIVYNPYPLDTLAMGVAGVTDYIDCLSTHSDPGACAPPPAENTLLEVLVNQGVEPIAVWGRCKSNYALSTWDVGAGALFLVGTSSSSTTTAARAVPPEVGAQAVAWAAALSPALLDCLQDPARLQVDYAACMRLYFSVTRAQAPNAYFLYEPQQQQTASGGSSEPPDACLVFSGLQAAASPGSPFETLMTDCGLQLDVGVPAACDLNPLIWSGNQPQKVAVAGVHGTVPPPAATLRAQAALLYAAPTAALRAAFAAFNATFANESAHIDAALFSVDGDFIHQFFDCLFLGPYTRLDLRACDAEGVLDCPYYARDELGGQSRNFTPCIGDALQGDHRLPYTCGSAARRSVIKYFYRDYSTTIGQAALGGNVSRLIRATVQAIYANYTADASRGCLDAATGRCSLAACAFETNGFTPCMDTTFQISSQRVADFIVEAILAELPQYYRLTQTSTVPWTAYSSSSNADNNTSSAAAGAFWRSDPAQAAVAASLSHFDPSATLLAYSAQEAYGMPTPQAARADPQADLAASAWSVCAALVGQLAMTLPIDPLTDLPVGVNFRQQPSQQTSTSTGLDFGDLDVVAAAVRNITQAAMRSGSPFVWHRDRRHAPSQSAVCRRDSPSLNTPHPGARLRVAAINIQTPAAAGSGSGSFTLQQNQQESFPLFGFLSRSLGDAGTQCVCALDHPTDLARCAVLPDTCATVLDLLLTTQQGCAPLVAACTTTGGGAYLRADAPGILGCLRRASQVLLLLLLFGR